MNQEKLARLVNLATVVGAAVTAASMIFGVMTYRRGVQVQHEAAAIGILQDYLKLSIQYPQLANGGVRQPDDPQYVWYSTHVLFTAETLWHLMGRNQQWESTIVFIVRPHRDYLERGALPCEAYETDFVNYLKEQFPTLKCSQSRPLASVVEGVSPNQR